MSASLVGSEMCIRDSRGHAAPRSVGARGSFPSRAPLLGAVRACPRGGEACLLYTSDAADDM
eukprot:13125884-Alexandrium_andersonii.AAC.1